MTGWICIDKPEGMTSFTAANRVRGILGLKKTGHTGTLDPMATGVLPIALSGTTRFIELLPVHEKAYTARVRLGLTTDTLDITGQVLSTAAVSVTPSAIEAAASKFLGETLQTPPMYSLADDIGKALGCGAVLTALRRTAANGFTLDNCITLQKLEQLRDANLVGEVLLQADAPLMHYPAVTVTAAQGVRFSNGGSLLRTRVGNPETGVYRVYDPTQKFLGLGVVENDESDSLSVKRVFVDG